MIIEAVKMHVGLLNLFGSIVKGSEVCCWVVTVTSISGVSTHPFVRLIRLGVILNTFIIKCIRMSVYARYPNSDSFRFAVFISLYPELKE